MKENSKTKSTDSNPSKQNIASEPFVNYSSQNPTYEFDRIQQLAESTKGIVMPNLKDKDIDILQVLPHNFNSNTPLIEAKRWAEKHLIKTYTSHIGTTEQFEYLISKSAIKKYIQSSKQSENLAVHLSVLKVLPQVIDVSIEVEIHADYSKVNGIRSVNNPINKSVLIHRFFGAILFKDSFYRIKTTIYEYRDYHFPNKPYTFEVIKIELLEHSNSSVSVASHPNSHRGLITNTAKLLQNIEKSYDKGKFLLDESEVVL